MRVNMVIYTINSTLIILISESNIFNLIGRTYCVNRNEVSAFVGVVRLTENGLTIFKFRRIFGIDS
tara:strand:- start:7455 stop:7652 length:198 start_codon:yes stop_codon:yes gene_type:complete